MTLFLNFNKIRDLILRKATKLHLLFMFKISAFIFSMIIGSANASILEFSKGDGVKSSEVNSNLEYFKNEIQSAIHSIQKS